MSDQFAFDEEDGTERLSENDKKLAYEFRDDPKYGTYNVDQLKSVIAERIITLNNRKTREKMSYSEYIDHLKRIIFLFENLDQTYAKQIKDTEIVTEDKIRIEYILAHVENDIHRFNTILGQLSNMGIISYANAIWFRNTLNDYYHKIIKSTSQSKEMNTILLDYETHYETFYDDLKKKCSVRNCVHLATTQDHVNLYELTFPGSRVDPTAAAAASLHIPLGGNKTKKYISKSKGKRKTKGKGKSKTKGKGKTKTKYNKRI